MLQSDQFNTPPRPKSARPRNSALADGKERPSPKSSSRKQRQRPLPQPVHNRTVSASNHAYSNNATVPDMHLGFSPPAAITPVRPMSTPSKAAYAGPTFSSSPAPSSLPIPKLLSRSAPDGPALGQAAKESPSSEQPEPALGRVSSFINEQSRVIGNSPLDIFFRADREERARLNSGSQSEVPKLDGFDQHQFSGPDSPSPSFRRPNRDQFSPPPAFPTSGMAVPGGEPRSPTHLPPRHRQALSSQSRQNVHRSHTAPSTVPVDDTEAAQQLRLKTQALKDILGV